MPRRLIENEEQRTRRFRANVVVQLENARREVGLARRYLDAPKEDPHWEAWTDFQMGKLASLSQDVEQLQRKIRELTLEFHDVGSKKEHVEVSWTEDNPSLDDPINWLDPDQGNDY